MNSAPGETISTNKPSASDGQFPSPKIMEKSISRAGNMTSTYLTIDIVTIGNRDLSGEQAYAMRNLPAWVSEDRIGNGQAGR